MRLLVALGLLCSLVATAQAGPREELDAARESVLTGECEKAIGQLSSLLYPTSRLAEQAALSEAHLMLGACYFETGNVSGAEREFEEALALEETIVLTTTVASANAVSFFEKTKAAIAQRAADAAEKERLARRSQALQRAVENLVVYEKRRYWVNFMPLGAGQFQNGDDTKGRLFFLGQSLAGGLSVGMWSYQVLNYGFGGTVPRDEVDTVNLIQRLQIGSGALFFGLWIWGSIDSLSNYEHTVKRQADPSLLKELEDILTPEAATSMRILPSFGPDNGSVSLQWEF